MQLINKSLKKSLTSATCALLGISAHANSLDDWNFDTALMYYGEQNRVSATEGVFDANKTFNSGNTLALGLVVDTLSGASANGAVAQPNAQTFTTASGKVRTPSKNSDIPLDSGFKDTRAQSSILWSQPIFTNNTISVGGYFSKESDYMSAGVNSNWAIDFNKKNSTLSFGFASAYDQVKPNGGIHDPLSIRNQTISLPVSNNDDGEGDGIDWNDSQPQIDSIIGNSDTKKSTDLLVGFTQVINRRMLIEFNYSYSSINGYMNDPYKILSVIDSNGKTQNYRYENRPDSRKKQAFYVQSKYHFDQGIMDLSYRYMTDDWKIKSSTFDFHYHQPLRHGFYIEPHIRYYTQKAADFYQPYLQNNEPLPTYASADYRLGALDTYTVGLKVGMPKRHGQQLTFRLEYYMQNAKNSGFATPGILADEPVFNGINAIIAQVSYSF